MRNVTPCTPPSAVPSANSAYRLRLFHPILRPRLRDRLPLHIAGSIWSPTLERPDVVDHKSPDRLRLMIPSGMDATP
jgi:hypothetical protein